MTTLLEKINKKKALAAKSSDATASPLDTSSSPDTVAVQQDPDALLLPVSQIEVTEQGRHTFDEIQELAENIGKNGQLQPIVVKQIDDNRYRLIAGERRMRAMTEILKYETVLARVRRVEESETDIRFVQLSENLQRDDYRPLELAEELADLKRQTGKSDEDIAREIGKGRSFVTKFIGLSNAPDEIKQAIAAGQVSATAWFNNKAYVNEQIERLQSASADTSDKASRPGPPKSKVRTPTVSITMDAGIDLAKILKSLAIANNLAEIDVDLGKAVTKKQLQAILVTRSREILESI